MQKLLVLNKVLFDLKNQQIKTKRKWKFIRIFFKQQQKKKIIKKDSIFYPINFFFFFYSFLVSIFSFRGNSGFGFKFFSKILVFSKLVFQSDSGVLLLDFLSNLLLPFDFRQKKKSGKALFLPMLINLRSQYSVLFRLFLKRKVRRSYSFFFFFFNTLRNAFLKEDLFYFQYRERCNIAVKHLRFLRFRW